MWKSTIQQLEFYEENLLDIAVELSSRHTDRTRSSAFYLRKLLEGNMCQREVKLMKDEQKGKEAGIAVRFLLFLLLLKLKEW